MGKWRVSIPETEIELEANDEGDALIQANNSFNVMDCARAEEITELEADSSKPGS